MIDNLSRQYLFGTHKTKYPLWRVAVNDSIQLARAIWDPNIPVDFMTPRMAGERVGRWAIMLRRWQQSRVALGVPENIFNAVDKVLYSRGGLTGDLPNFYAMRQGSTTNELFYTVRIGRLPTADIDKVQKWESELEETLFDLLGAGANVRVCYKPLSIQIDRTDVPTFAFADYWPQIAKLPTNERIAVPGVSVGASVDLEVLRMVNDRFTGFVVADPGFGKTQLAMSMILSLALTNSPATLSMFIADPKADDWIALGKLPHLAAPIVTEAGELLSLLRRLVTEMENRKSRSSSGDRSFKRQTILLYIDELSDVFAELQPAEREEMATLLQRLTQRGRSAGFIVLAATQRINDLAGYAKAYSKLRVRFAGNTGSNVDAATIAGAGVQLSKLPVGGFEIHRDGTPRRLQGFFVADADSPDYTKTVGRYIADIAKRWAGVAPFYGPGPAVDTLDNTDLLAGLPVDGDNVLIDGSSFPQAFVAAVIDAYRADAESLTAYRIGALHKQMFGKDLRGDRRNKVLAFVAGNNDFDSDGE
jgi:hypothetical protein